MASGLFDSSHKQPYAYIFIEDLAHDISLSLNAHTYGISYAHNIPTVVYIVFPPASKKGMVKFPRKGHFQRAAKCKGGTFKRTWTY